MNKRRVIALGFFDGVHIGHGALLKKTYERARELDAVPSAMSFDTHPDTLVFGTPAELLNTMDERKHLMQSLYGIEDVIFCHFDRDMMNMPWEAFVEDYLVKELHACHLVCGHDYRFGARGIGDAQKLTEKCRALGLGCDVIGEVKLDGITVSSTHLRTLLKAGEMETAVRFLGHGHILSGIVQHGDELSPFDELFVLYAERVDKPVVACHQIGGRIDGRDDRRSLDRIGVLNKIAADDDSYKNQKHDRDSPAYHP